MAEIITALATDDEREACYQLAYEVFCTEMGTMQDLADHERRLVRDEAIERAHLVYARVDGELAGTLGILWGGDAPFPDYFTHGFDVPHFLPVVSHAQMSINIRFLVRKPFRGSVVPFRLIAEAARFQVTRGIRLGFCDCQPHLLPLYLGLGFRPCAPVFDQPGFGVMVPLAFSLSDFDYLRALHSPLLRSLPASLEDRPLAARIQALLPADPPVMPPTASGRGSQSALYHLLCQEHGDTSPFSGLSEAEFSTLLAQSQLIECHRGQQVIVHDQGTQTVYVVLEGVVEVCKDHTWLATLTAGEVVGEFAFLLHSKRTADVYAVSERVRLLALSPRTLHRLVASHSALATKFLLNLSRALTIKLMHQGMPAYEDQATRHD